MVMRRSGNSRSSHVLLPIAAPSRGIPRTPALASAPPCAPMHQQGAGAPPPLRTRGCNGAFPDPARPATPAPLSEP
jgi:hypothetical protein